MIREHLPVNYLQAEANFRWRGGDITRLEGFSDAVFAFAVTLLVVSLEVPKTFTELLAAMRGFAAFAVCFALLADVWYNHYRFFRRYGLQDPWTVFLNCVLLFFVLFYVYPLKLLFATVFNNSGKIAAEQARVLFMIYGAGYAAVFLVLALLYLHAWRKRREQQAQSSANKNKGFVAAPLRAASDDHKSRHNPHSPADSNHRSI
jgi:uncharacterized membrane protein